MFDKRFGDLDPRRNQIQLIIQLPTHTLKFKSLYFQRGILVLFKKKTKTKHIIDRWSTPLVLLNWNQKLVHLPIFQLVEFIGFFKKQSFVAVTGLQHL